MNKVWAWIAGTVIALALIALLFGTNSNRKAYWVARAVVPRVVQVTNTENLTLVRFPCSVRAGSIKTANECGFYVWKK